MVYIQLERRALLALCYWFSRKGFGSTNFSTAFRLRNCHFVFFFLVFFLLFFFVSFYRIFLKYFSLLSPVSLTLLPCPLLHSRGNDHLFSSRAFVRLFALSWFTQKVRAVLWSERNCTDWRFSVMETLAVILNCIWQVKRPKVPFNSVWNLRFSRCFSKYIP